jgi:hypothetical protein
VISRLPGALLAHVQDNRYGAGRIGWSPVVFLTARRNAEMLRNWSHA